jgi:hypothetical protein
MVVDAFPKNGEYNIDEGPQTLLEGGVWKKGISIFAIKSMLSPIY